MQFRLISLILIFVSISLSCKKEEIIDVAVEETTKIESVDPNMTKTTVNMRSGVEYFGDVRGGYSGILSSYSWAFDYRLEDGFTHNEKVFYPIAKKWRVTGYIYEQEQYTTTDVLDTWEKEIDWSKTERLYRYDPNSAKSYIYEGEDDQSPTLIMDFNLAIGDIWFFDLEHEVCLVVKDKYTVVSNGITYPALVVQFKSQHETSKHRVSSGEILITPLNPNPMLMGAHYAHVYFPNWQLFQTNEIQTEPEYKWLPDQHLVHDVRSGLLELINWENFQFDQLPKDYENKIGYHIEN